MLWLDCTATRRSPRLRSSATRYRPEENGSSTTTTFTLESTVEASERFSHASVSQLVPRISEGNLSKDGFTCRGGVIGLMIGDVAGDMVTNSLLIVSAEME